MTRDEALRLACLASVEERLKEARDVVGFLATLALNRRELAKSEPKVWAREAKKVAQQLAAARLELKTWKAAHAALQVKP